MTIAIDHSIQRKPLSFDEFLLRQGNDNRYAKYGLEGDRYPAFRSPQSWAITTSPKRRKIAVT